ncbi:MAG: formylglycine-generating enzyme family protein [Saprospiraceae bacterium]
MPPANLKITLPGGFSFDMVYVEGGEFLMGSNEHDDEKPIHRVKVSSFYMGKHQVTQRLWQNLTKENPSVDKGENRPVENVSWDMTRDFIKKLNLGIPEGNMRLPTEAEWEFAARGGIYSQGYTYAGSDKLKQVGWYYDENSGGESHEAGLLRPNELGLYDMSGNVWEWCEDDWHDNYDGAPKDGFAWIDSPGRGVYRVLRGGSSFFDAAYCRSAYRYRYTPGYRFNNYGFRLCLSLQSVG